jgi:hypothetical protein
MAAVLKSLGFEVDLLQDAGLAAMEDAVVRMGSALAAAPQSTGFFYYAGHGIQSNGNNYLIPADARIAGEAFLKSRALAAQEVLAVLSEAKNGLNIIVLDACRDNPFGWSRSGSRGLGVIGNQPQGSIVVYSTSAGAVAQDGTGRNGAFTEQLLKNLSTPGLEIKEVFNRTGADVMEATGGKQVPAVYSQFFKSAYLSGNVTQASVRAPVGEGRISLPWVPAGSRITVAGSSDQAETTDAWTSDKLPAGEYPIKIEGRWPWSGTARVLEGRDFEVAGYREGVRAAITRAKQRDEAQRDWLKLKPNIGIASIALGTASLVGTGLSYWLGNQAGAAYNSATDSSEVAAARAGVELYSSLFVVTAGLGLAGFAASPFFLAGSSDTTTLERSIAILNAQIKALK